MNEWGMLTLQSVIEIKDHVENAFKPLNCRAQVYETGRKLRFKVFDKDNDTAFEISDLALTDLLDETRLSRIIESACAQIHARRFRLNFGTESPYKTAS
jgi:Protein of unknown function (DUF1652)